MKKNLRLIDKDFEVLNGYLITIASTKPCRGISYMHLIKNQYRVKKKRLKYSINHPFVPEIFATYNFSEKHLDHNRMHDLILKTCKTQRGKKILHIC